MNSFPKKSFFLFLNSYEKWTLLPMCIGMCIVLFFDFLSIKSYFYCILLVPIIAPSP
ncbi:hypothetical protein KP1_1123 [Klebsiella pneumoniae subsp. pneumoniae NTUH-K2044]|nr:hypothetical protein KP1_1123 [Klebsiella pneumoniae subsp. pneumoniae NTUH-K2044]